MVEAQKTDYLRTQYSHERTQLPNGWNDNTFLPYDYGYFALYTIKKIVESA
ncbi:hypothetical protein QWZ16_16095 [Vibrio ostreicida]|uniref:Uncharacterized protein n=1 Tax=Vibrio ostreicida TaxID=526588 RepID=A0ABT8BVH6_9VIBR|nr:hypothetical protein [Vibrio ostreicida]MDN3611162.1 hypothetical protein [Vibrio ostreicida]